MNGKVAKRLRKIARALKLDPTTSYAPGGKLRRRPSVRNALTGELIEGAPIPRPFVLTVCTRKAYKEAKKLYRGLPPTNLEPRGEDNKTEPMRVRIQHSVGKMDAYDGVREEG